MTDGTAVFETARRGSIPRRGTETKRPWGVPDSHTTLRRSRTRFNSWRGHYVFVVLQFYHELSKGGVPCAGKILVINHFFERMSKRRKGFPSETNVKRGVRVIQGTKELREKLGRNDLCPCGSGRSF